MHLCQALQHWQSSLSGPSLLYPCWLYARLLGTGDWLNYRSCSCYSLLSSLVIIHINFQSWNLEGIQRTLLTCVWGLSTAEQLVATTKKGPGLLRLYKSEKISTWQPFPFITLHLHLAFVTLSRKCWEKMPLINMLTCELLICSWVALSHLTRAWANSRIKTRLWHLPWEIPSSAPAVWWPDWHSL